MSWSGACQCGAVRFEVQADALIAYACHCSECRRQAASAYGLSVPVMEPALSVGGDLSRYDRPASEGAMTECYFCPSCGSRVFHRSSKRQGMVTVKGGLFDRASELEPKGHVWVRSKLAWVEIPDDAPQWKTQPQTMQEWAGLWRGEKV